jgi:hypothetical protein
MQFQQGPGWLSGALEYPSTMHAKGQHAAQHAHTTSTTFEHLQDRNAQSSATGLNAAIQMLRTGVDVIKPQGLRGCIRSWSAVNGLIAACWTRQLEGRAPTHSQGQVLMSCHNGKATLSLPGDKLVCSMHVLQPLHLQPNNSHNCHMACHALRQVCSNNGRTAQGRTPYEEAWLAYSQHSPMDSV